LRIGAGRRKDCILRFGVQTNLYRLLTMPQISIVIPAYNQAHYLGRALHSALAQTHRALEVIVVDDGSTDDTALVAQAFADSRVRYVYQENRGLSAARNAGLREASGVFISFLDSDDQFLPHKLELLLAELERHPEAGLAAGQAIPVDQDGQPIGKVFDKGLPAESAQWLLGNPLHVGSVLARREWQERVGFFDESLRSYEDWDLWLRLARAGCPMRWVAQPVSLYRFHRAQMTRDGRQMTTATFAVLDKVFKDPALPQSWYDLRDQAYSNAYLRAAAQAYQVGDFDAAKTSLTQAVQLNPTLAADGGAALAGHFAAWTDLPKTSEPLAFLQRIYGNLPDSLAELRQRRHQHLGQAAMAMAFALYRRGDRASAKTTAWQAVRYQPGWLANRGALAVLVHSSFSRRSPVFPKKPDFFPAQNQKET
jgi:glycosyltransferase involved in cell wall biosynthesis/cation transport regulator ChaB